MFTGDAITYPSQAHLHELRRQADRERFIARYMTPADDTAEPVTRRRLRVAARRWTSALRVGRVGA